MNNDIPRDPYRDWNYAERCDARRSDDPEMRRAAQQADKDFESSERAYDSWQAGGEFSDPNSDGRFH